MGFPGDWQEEREVGVCVPRRSLRGVVSHLVYDHLHHRCDYDLEHDGHDSESDGNRDRDRGRGRDRDRDCCDRECDCVEDGHIDIRPRVVRARL